MASLDVEALFDFGGTVGFSVVGFCVVGSTLDDMLTDVNVILSGFKEDMFKVPETLTLPLKKSELLSNSDEKLGSTVMVSFIHTEIIDESVKDESIVVSCGSKVDVRSVRDVLGDDIGSEDSGVVCCLSENVDDFGNTDEVG